MHLNYIAGTLPCHFLSRVPTGDRESSGHVAGSAEEDDDSATDHGLPIHRSSTSATASAPGPANPAGPLRDPDHEPPVPHPVINMAIDPGQSRW